MKLLHIICDLNNGGAQTLLKDLIPLQKKEIEVDLLVFENSDTEILKYLKHKNINVFTLNSKKIRNPINIIKLKKFINNYDIIHSHTTTPQLYLAICNLFLKKKIITTEHSTSNKRRKLKWYRPIDRFMYSQYDKVICISESTKNNLEEWIKPKDIYKYKVINNGIDLNKFRINSNIPFEFMKLGKPVITMVSRFVPAKDHTTVIKAIPYINDNAVFVFVGDGDNKKSIEDLASKLNISERCIFLGNRNDVPRIINSSTIGIQSSHWEGFGLTAVEFMAASKPIIGSDVEGLKQVIQDAGLIFKQGDEKDLASKINKLLLDRKFYNEISEKCFKRSLIYNIQETANKYFNVYNEVINL